MISVSEAQTLVIKYAEKLPICNIELENSLGYFLAEDCIAPISLPSFRQSAMDGYAFINTGDKHLKVIGQVQAGDSITPQLKSGEAIRIFTGAPLPDGADTVVIQEHVNRDGDSIHIEKLPALGANVRPIAEQLKAGTTVLKTGHKINEASIGFMAGLGLTHLKAYQKPRICILTTGNELQTRGTLLKPNHIYESNGIMLETALKRLGVFDIQIVKVEDSLSQTIDAVHNSLKSADVLLVSGGISVGDFDFVREAFQQNEIEEHFYKVNQKPGKPLWFGSKGSKSVFGLPGNPASSLSCFYAYVLPHIQKRSGSLNPFLEKRTAFLTEKIKNIHSKTLFLKAGVYNNEITPFTGQASSMLNTFANSNALLIVPEQIEDLEIGDSVSYLDLNY
ncbi:gephyrin-like molybdotransferase Glp [Leeuwenhoekiella sp. LLG6367-2.1]|uniref:molybdopterin molybdotransferase MoeA n=1 Tax=Leeuwenhoekiella sp. LLG6367-2.1 TaxID=3160833 RepID=UPI00386A5919